MTDPRPHSSRLPRLTFAFAGLFVLSGACGLTYEVVWSRLLVQVFGVTAFAVSTVLVSFMGGMALGAALMGRRVERARRPLRWFAALEAGIGLYALVLPWLLDGVDLAYGAAVHWIPDAVLARSLVRFALCLVVLLVPTVLMGGTLPALGQGLLRRRDEVGLGVGLLYFVNTIGAGIGCYVAGFVLIPGVGLRTTTLLAAAVNGLIAVAGWSLDRGSAPASGEAVAETPTRGTTAPLTVPQSWPLIVAFGSGMTALAFEVVWFRVLVLVFGSTVYSFSAMLAVFLVGLAIGSLALGPLADRAARPVRLLALTQGAVALFAIAGGLAVNWMPELFLRLLDIQGLDFTGMNRTKLILSVATLLPPALAFGGTFPVAVRLYARREAGTGSTIGRVYAWNTLGAILGSFGAGFLLLPTIGSEWTLKLVVIVSLALAFGSVLAEPGALRIRWAVPAGLGVVLLAAMAVFAPRWDRTLLGAGTYFEPRQFLDPDGGVELNRVTSDYELMTYTEGYNETIISYRSPKGRFITVNGSTTASDQFEDMFSQRMLGHLPMALHPGDVRRAAIVGLGAGVTAGAIALYEVEELVAVELEKGVFVASRFFENENHHVLDNPSVTIRIDDGRNYLKLTDDTFDVISSAPNFPSLTGSGALYSREFFELARSRLAPGGVMCQFAPIWRLYPEDVHSIVRSFGEVFPHFRVFSTGLSLVMLGREEPFPAVDLDELTRRVSRPEVAGSLGEIGVRGPIELLSFYQFDEVEAMRLASDAPVNTDDEPWIEFHAPRGLFADTVGPNLARIREFRPSLEERSNRLGIESEPFRSSFLALASAYDATTDAEIAFWEGDPALALSRAIPVAQSGQRYAAYLVADHLEHTAMTLQSEGRLHEARAAFAAVLQFEPDRLDSLLGLGYLDLFLGRPEEAEASLLRAIELYPRSAAAHHRLGILREMQGRTAEAESLYRRAITLQPLQSKAHALLGRILIASERPSEALERFRVARELGEDTEGVVLGLGEAHLATGSTREALNRGREAVERHPNSPAAFEFLARAADAAGKAAEATDARRRRDTLEAVGASPGPTLPQRSD